MKKRIFSLLLAMVMLFTLSAVAVSAEDAVVEDVPVEDVPVEDVLVATGINITKPSLPEYSVTSKVANNFPATEGGSEETSNTCDPGISVPDEYAIAQDAFTVAVEEGKATLTYSDVNYGLLRLLFKTKALSGANYLTFHIDTTNLSGTAYFNLRLNNAWNTTANLITGSKYYFLPDATEENPDPKTVSYEIGDTSFEGFAMPAGIIGTIYLPLTSFTYITSFDSITEYDALTHTYHQNTAIYLENKMEYDGGAVAGDSIVFSNLEWKKIEPTAAANLGYNAEYLTNNFSKNETGKFDFNSSVTGNGWDNWQSPEIGGYFNETFDAIKFDLDYSEFTGNECYMSLRYIFNLTVDGVTTLHRYFVQKNFYVVWEDGKVQELEPNPGWQQGAIQFPSGFKGTVIIPFSSFVDVNGDGLMFTDAAEYPKMEMWFYKPTSSPAAASVDNFGFLTTYNATDLVSVRAQLMGETYEETEKTVDLNGDGAIDAIDIVKLKKIVAWAA